MGTATESCRAWPRETCNETGLDGIADARHNNGNVARYPGPLGLAAHVNFRVYPESDYAKYGGTIPILELDLSAAKSAICRAHA